MRKLLTLMLILTFCAPVLAARLNKMQIQIVDEWGDPHNLTTDASGYIYDVDSTDSKFVYADAAGTLTAATPFTDDSDNTIITDYELGKITFWMKGGSYKLYLTDGTYIRTIDNLTGSDARVSWPSYLQNLTSFELGASADLDFTIGAWVMDGPTAGLIELIPDVADGIFNIGDATGTKQGDVYIYASSTEYMFFNQDSAIITNTHIDYVMDDDSALFFGDGKDISVKFDNTNDDLDITGSGSEIAIGADNAGLDVIIHGNTTGENITWDEDADSLTVTGDLAKFNLTGTNTPFYVDVTGTAGGMAIIMETTDGAFSVNADGSSFGDVILDAADIIELINADSILISGVATQKIVIEGTTNAYEATLQFTDPTVDVTWVYPTAGSADSFAVLGSTLETNIAETASAVWAASNTVIFEGTTANDHETTLAVGDPTADVTWIMPPYATADTLAIIGTTHELNVPEIASSVWGASNSFIFEGTTANAHETFLTAIDPTADVDWLFPAYATADRLAIMGSTLETNVVDVANSVWGGTSQLIFEGTTANTIETIIAVTDPTVADKTFTLPNANSGYLLPVSYTAAAATATLSATQCWGSIISNISAVTGFTLTLPSAVAGMHVTIVSATPAYLAIDVTAGDGIKSLTDGVNNAIQSDGSTGPFLTLHAIDTTWWVPIACSGAWTDID